MAEPFSNIQEAARLIGTLSREDRRGLATAVEATPAEMDLGVFSNRVAERAKQDEFTVYTIINALAGFVPVLPSGGSGFVAQISRFVAGQVSKADEERNDIAAAIEQILGAERTFVVTAKAQDIMWGHGRVFRDARIITESRPIFLSNPAIPPERAVIVHQLRVDYREGSQDHAFYVGLDLRQLNQLIAVAQRAKEKEASLRTKNPPYFLAP